MRITIYDTAIYTKAVERYLIYFIELLIVTNVYYPLNEMNLKNNAILEKCNLSKNRQYYILKKLFLKLRIITTANDYYSSVKKIAREYKINLFNFCNLLNEIYFETAHQVHYSLPNLSKLISMKYVPKSVKIYLEEYQKKNLSYYSDKWLYDSRTLRSKIPEFMEEGIHYIYAPWSDEEYYQEFGTEIYFQEQCYEESYSLEGHLSFEVLEEDSPYLEYLKYKNCFYDDDDDDELAN